ncbi:cell division protein FtsH, partial [Streptomyces sp. SID7499]|nr:cell division protein FtsH [Streptomyces sp. SID7499]
LLEKETLGKDEIAEIFAPLVRRPARPAWTGSARRTPSTRPPVLSPKELALTNGASIANGSATPPEIAPTDLTKDIAPSTEAIPEDRPES